MSSLEVGPEAGRRKVRKGTQSCWECKRRKVRCIFASAERATCNNCRRRGTACISQELPDRRLATPNDGPSHVEARLSRVEALIEPLVHNAPVERPLEATPKPTPLARKEAQETLTASSPGPRASQVPDRQRDKYDRLSRDLIAVWPSQAELNTICSLPVGHSTPLYLAMCIPYSNPRDPPSLQEMLRLPPPGSHPVLIARKLLLLGMFLQGVVLSSIRALGSPATSYREIMSRVVDRAIRLVTTNDEFTGSVEGIECIMMEAMYHNYTGNLHLAWMALSRATAVAQMMALHRGICSPSLKIIEPETRETFNPELICFRLVQMDRYLALMLGLPQTSLQSRFASANLAEGSHPVTRLERIHCAVAGRILSRTDAELDDHSITQEIDCLLQDAAAEMPATWWLVPRFVDDAELVSDTIRIMNHFTHHHLLIRLYLPYMFRSSSDGRYDQLKITAVNSSCEILSRFITFRTSNPTKFYCRGTDFLAFVASTVMCLAHINSLDQSSNKPGTVLNFLAHSRPSNRGMMERTLEIFESMVDSNGTDQIATKLTRIIRDLLAIEANTAHGAIYGTSSSRGDEGEYDGNVVHGDKGLLIRIPYFGTINFERRPISRTASQLEAGLAAPSTPNTTDNPQFNDKTKASTNSDHTPTAQAANPLVHPGNTSLQLPVPPPVPGLDDNWELQGIDIALFDSLFRGGGWEL
ncbi:uncharacterized protein BJX67DRAFT_382005 [Aspergillus lucknowensis]|uniref:Zn(2)-C6 fungal-type domain-containing protein n=1 Tax=Aspergillus lucknowensis TaxID=176173 RepID=A0ABR4LS18_9EURO